MQRDTAANIYKIHNVLKEAYGGTYSEAQLEDKFAQLRQGEGELCEGICGLLRKTG